MNKNVAWRYGAETWTEDQIQAMGYDSVVDSTACPECGSTQRVEPDASGYDCHDCGKGKVHSPLTALGLC